MKLKVGVQLFSVMTELANDYLKLWRMLQKQAISMLSM